MTPTQTIGSEFIRRFTEPRCSIKPADWCEANVMFDEPNLRGRFNFAGREYLRDCVNDVASDETDFVYVWGTGVGKTITFIGQAMFEMATNPTRCLWVFPSSPGPGGSESFVNTRLKPCLEATPWTRDKLQQESNRFAIKKSSVRIAGTVLDFVGSNSPAQVAANRCSRVRQDEVEKFDKGSDEEPSAVYNADRRTDGVQGAKRFKASSPTLEKGLIWQEFLKSDQQRRFLPCPHCGEFVVLAWKAEYTCFKLEGYEAFVHWDDSAKLADGTWDFAKVEQTAHYVCPFCKGKITDGDKFEMDKRGVWRATAKGFPKYRGRHLPSMYSSSSESRVGALAVKFLECCQTASGIKGFINSKLAEVDTAQGGARQSVDILTLKPKEEQKWMPILTTDVQQNWPYFWFVVRKWLTCDCEDGKQGDSMAIHIGHLDDWRDIEEIQAQYAIENKNVVADSGWGATDNASVYAECAMKARQYCFYNPMTRQFSASHMPGYLAFALDGWLPSKGFPKDKRWKDAKRIVQPYEMHVDDPMKGKAEAGKLFHWVFNFSKQYFLDELQRIRNKKTSVWGVADDCTFTGEQCRNIEDYNRHMAGKWKDSDGVWQEKKLDHLYDCENIQLAYATYKGFFAFTKQNETQPAKEKK